MDYYYKELEKLQKEFHDVMHEYPLFKEIFDDIEKNDIKEINELLDKHDEFYLKKAIDKLKDLINYIKNTSNSIKDEYNKFDKLAGIWEKTKLSNISEDELNDINSKVKKANELIKSHDIKDLVYANKIMEDLVKLGNE